MKQAPWGRFVVPLVLALLVSGCGGGDDFALPSSSSPVVDVGPTGRIRGVVRFDGDPPAPSYDPITENQNVCGDQALLPRLHLGESAGVKDAFVFVEGLSGFPDARAATGTILIDQSDCKYAPHAMAVPVGTQIDIVNSDPILHNVHAQVETASGRRTLFNIAQAVAGARTTVDLDLDEPGIIYLTCEAGHPWMNAYIFVTDHPYIAVTAENGEFVIDNVPEGAHSITMWHEGVNPERIIASLQRYVYEAPYAVTREVVVEADAEVVVDFSFALRPPESE